MNQALAPAVNAVSGREHGRGDGLAATRKGFVRFVHLEEYLNYGVCSSGGLPPNVIVIGRRDYCAGVVDDFAHKWVDV